MVFCLQKEEGNDQKIKIEACLVNLSTNYDFVAKEIRDKLTFGTLKIY